MSFYANPLTYFQSRRLGWATVIRELPKDAPGLVQMLDIELAGLRIQRERIKENLMALTGESKDVVILDDVWPELLLDVHLYLVLWSGVRKLVHRLSKICRDSKLDALVHKYDKWFKRVADARNGFEHIDERILKYHRKPSQLIGLIGRDQKTVIVCGIRVRVSEASFAKIDKLEADIARWMEKLPTIAAFRQTS